MGRDSGGCRLHLNIQKARQFGPATCVYLPSTGTSTCPVRALRRFVVVEQAPGAPVFVTSDGTLVSRQSLPAVG